MANIITIQVDALTEQANAQLQKFFSNLNDKINAGTAANKAHAAAATENAEALQRLRESSLLARESFHGLEQVILLTGGERMEGLARGLFAGRAAMGSIRTAAKLFGLSLAEILPPIAIAGAAIGGAALLWSRYSGEQKKAAESAKQMEEALKNLPDLITRVFSAQKSGLIGPGTGAEILAYLHGGKKLYKRSGKVGGTGEDALQLTEQPSEVRDVPGHLEFAEQASHFVPADTVTTQLKEASFPEVMEFIQKQLLPEQEKADTLEKLQKQEQSAAEKNLTGIAKEQAAIHERYQAEREEMEKTAAYARSIHTLTPRGEKDVAHAEAQLDTAEQAEKDASAAKAHQEDLTKAIQATNKVREFEAQEVADQNKRLEAELTADALAKGLQREQNYQHEFDARTRLLGDQLLAGLIDEKEYTEGVESERNKRLEGARKEAAEMLRLHQEIVQASVQKALDAGQAAENDPYLTDAKKVDALRAQLPALMEGRADLLRLSLQDNLTAERGIDLARQRETLDKSITGYEQRLKQLEDSRSGIAQMRLGLVQLSNAWSNLGANVAHTALSGIQDAVHGVSTAIMGAITHTASWGKVFSQVGDQIIASLIEVVVEWIAQMTIIAALQELFGTQSAATTNTMASAATKAWTPAAIAASTATHGEAAGFGLAAFLASIMVGQGVAQGLAGFGGARAGGGPVYPGLGYLVGEIGPELFMPRTSGTIIPHSAISGQGGGKGGGNVNLLFYDERPHPADYLATPPGEMQIVNIARKHRMKIGIKTGSS
jgi:hypothetical protein